MPPDADADINISTVAAAAAVDVADVTGPINATHPELGELLAQI